MSRIPSFGQQIAAYMRPILAGKIDRSSCGYIFSDAGYTNPQGVHFKSFNDDMGRAVSLHKVRQSKCPDPDKRGGEYPIVRNHAFVPEKVCKACPHRLPKTCCALLKASAFNSLKTEVEA